MYVYDFKFPDLAEIAYNHCWNKEGYKKGPASPSSTITGPASLYSQPDQPFFYETPLAHLSAYTIMLNLNKTWVHKQGDFFIESPIILFAAVIWFLRIYDEGTVLYLPHAIEFLNKRYEDIFPILTAYPEVGKLFKVRSWMRGSGRAQTIPGPDSLGQNSALAHDLPQLYWVMSGDDFTLDINNPDDPQDTRRWEQARQAEHLQSGLGTVQYPYREAHQKKGQLKSSASSSTSCRRSASKGLDNLIATARSNKDGRAAGFQDLHS